MSENTTFIGNLVNVADYGAIGNGVADDTQAIAEAVQQVNLTGGCLFFPTGKYRVIPSGNNQSFINIQSDKKIIVDFNNSEIILQENHYYAYQIILVNNEAETIIKNGYLIGDRLAHDYVTLDSTHEFGYGIFISQKNVTIQNMNISQMTGDAIVTKNGVYGGKINILNSELSYCRRQGISILDSDEVNLFSVNIHHIGTWDNISGASPMSGIDIEAASGSLNVNKVSLHSVNITDITKVSLICSGRCSSLSLQNCYLDSGTNISCPATISNCNIDKKYVSDIPYFFGANVQMFNSKVRLSVESIFWLFATLDNCIVECSDDIINGVYLVGKLTNCVIRNFGDHASQTYIAFKTEISNSFSNINNCCFESCDIYGVGAESFCPQGIVFKDCTVRVTSGGYVKKCEFYGCNLIGNICQIDCYDSYFDTVPFTNTYNHFYNCILNIPSAQQEQFCVQSQANYNVAVNTIFKINGECHDWAFKHIYVENGMRFIKSIIELPAYEKGTKDLQINATYNDVQIIYKDGVM